MNERLVAIVAVGVVAVLLAAAVAIRWVATGDEPPAQLVTILATLAGVLLGTPALKNGVRAINGKINSQQRQS